MSRLHSYFHTMFCDNWYLTRSLSLRRRLTSLVASPPNDLLSWGHPHSINTKKK